MNYSQIPLEKFNTEIPVHFPLAGIKLLQHTKNRFHYQDNGNLYWPKSWGSDTGGIRGQRHTMDGFQTCYWLQPIDHNPAIHGLLRIDSATNNDAERLKFLSNAVEDYSMVSQPTAQVDVVECRIPVSLSEMFFDRNRQTFFIALRHPDKATRECAIDSLAIEPDSPARILWEANQ